uniref:Uncharacterized protein n=1 Tax=Anguilla anguilla TaxID=7936 RepID=A0A0E9PW15_ANGAN
MVETAFACKCLINSPADLVELRAKTQANFS